MVKIVHNGKEYETQYYPFFRIKKKAGYQVFGVRYPSGHIERVITNNENYLQELNEYLKFVIAEYMLEDDDMLTPCAKRLKYDVQELFRSRDE